jgi:uncharacterized protein YbjT (DUF2867 family)
MILVTGGTGLIGSEVLRRLSHAGVPAHALTRDLTKAQTMPGVAWVAGDLGKPETLHAAFDGVTTLFLLTHYLKDMVELQHNAIAAARAAGVTHVVKVSAFAASDHSKAPIGRWHYHVEKELQESGLGWTMLRPHHFMQNLLAQAEYVKKEGAICSPSGDEDSLCRWPRRGSGRRRDTHHTGTYRQKIRPDRERGDVLPPGGRDHRCRDRQAGALR